MKVTDFDKEDMASDVEQKDDVENGAVESASTIEAHPLSSCTQSKINAIHGSVPFLALLHTVSIAIFVIYLSEQFKDASTQTLAEKIAAPLAPWMVVSLANGWLYWNGIAGRSHGKEDAPIITSNDENFSNDSWRVFIAMVGILPNFTAAFLIIVASQAPSNRKSLPVLMLAILAGLLTLVVSMLTEIIFCFRKHVEYCERQSRPINQRLVKSFYDRATYLEIFIDKLYPLINGLARTQAYDQLIASWLALAALPSIPTNLIRLICAFLIYSSSAFTLTKFDVAQLKENLDSTSRVRKNMEDYVPVLKTQCGGPFRLLDNLRSGQLLYNGFRRCFSIETSTNIMLSLSTIGLAGLGQRALCNYVICDNPVATQAGTNSLLTGYLLGTKAAINVAPKLTYFMDALPVVASAVVAKIKAPMVKKETRAEEQRQALSQTRVGASG